MSKTQAEKFADRYKRKPTKPVLTFSLQVKLLDEKLAAITAKMLAIGNKPALYAKPAILKAEREYDILKQEYLDLLVKHPNSKSLENIDAALATCINSIRREKTKFI